MRVVCLDGLPKISFDSEGLPRGVLAICRTGDYVQDLHETDRRYVSSATMMRQHAFSSGRRVARVALDRFAFPSDNLSVCCGLPQWPEDVVGNITHTDELSACVVVETVSARGIGIDLQKVASVSKRVAQRVLLPKERDWISRTGNHEWLAVFFCAKEAAYKAVNPVMGEFLGFQDVQLRFDDEMGSFLVSTVADRPSSSMLARGRGCLRRIEKHWLSLFVIPANAASD